MNSKLKAIIEQAAADLVSYAKEGEEKILNAWAKAEEAAELNDTTPKFSLGYSISLDLDKDTMTTDLSWRIKESLSRTANIPDPNQVPLPLQVDEDDEKPEVHAGPVITPKRAADLLKAVKHN